MEGQSYDPLHKHLQNKLREILIQEYGNSHVVCERDDVDVTVDHPDFHALIEVKTCNSAVEAIRDGIGQLLHYAFRAEQRAEGQSRLIIAAPPPSGGTAEKLLRFLRTRFGIHLTYWSVHRDTSRLPL